jgi:predicted GIY-YIG superfamily endonuclease
MRSLYKFYDKDDDLLYVGQTNNILRRLSEHQYRKFFAEFSYLTHDNGYETKEDVLKAERKSILEESPKYNIKLNSTRRKEAKKSIRRKKAKKNNYVYRDKGTNTAFKFKGTDIAELLKLSMSEYRLFQYCLADDDIIDYIKNNKNYAVYRNEYCGVMGGGSSQYDRFTVMSCANDIFSIKSSNQGKLNIEFNRLYLDLFEKISKLLSKKPEFNIKFYSIYSYKLYYFLLCNRGSGKRGDINVDLDELKIIWGLKDKYPQWVEFRRNAIDKAVEEITLSSPMSVSYKSIKRGRSIKQILFTLT